ncbi:MAG: hypothetical protein IPJ19_01570 [Planctomycetes bacterium]|nr:hypothetical protein [Planctomycetota bacterium]
MQSRARWSLVAAGCALALGSALLPWPEARLALGGIGAFVCARALGLAAATGAFVAAGYAGSAALAWIGPRGDHASYASFAEIGTGMATLALLLAWRRTNPPAQGPRWAGALGILFASGACFWSARSSAPDGQASGWFTVFVAAPVWVFALAGCASAAGVLRRRGLVQLAALVATLLALRYPAGCALTAPVGALALALCAGDALESAPRAARTLGAAVFALLAALAWSGLAAPPGAGGGEPLDTHDEWVQWQRLPALPGTLAYAVEVDARVPVASVVLACVGEDDGRRVEWPMRREALPAGARFTHAPVRLARLAERGWRVELELFGKNGERTGVRVIDRLVLPQAPAFSFGLLAFVLAGLLCAGLLRSAAARTALAAALCSAAQAVWFYARG